MRYPVDNYLNEWNNSAGYDFADATSYGFHDGKDINDNGSGDSDLGKPLYAIANGTVVGIHSHSTKPTFGKHFFIQIDGAWGTRYVHYAHCNEIFITEGQAVKEGDKVATVGKSGTDYAHCHFAIKKKANGMDTIAKTKDQLYDAWEDPIAFIAQYMSEPTINQQAIIDELRTARDNNWDLYQAELQKNTELTTQRDKLTKDLADTETKLGQCLKTAEEINDQDKSTTAQLIDAQKALKPYQDLISAMKKELGVTDDAQLLQAIKDLKKSKVKIQDLSKLSFYQKFKLLFGK